MTKQANIDAPKFGEDQPKHGRAIAEPRGPGIFRVSLSGVTVRVNFDETMPGGPQYRDYLEVSATDEQDAIEKFAKYNGIPMRTDTLTGEVSISSIHRPVVERMTGEEAEADAAEIKRREAEDLRKARQWEDQNRSRFQQPEGDTPAVRQAREKEADDARRAGAGKETPEARKAREREEEEARRRDKGEKPPTKGWFDKSGDEGKKHGETMLAADDPILTAIANLKIQIAEITANPKPDYTVGNRTISWGAHYANLVGQLRPLLEAAQDLDGPWEINQVVNAGW